MSGSTSSATTACFPSNQQRSSLQTPTTPLQIQTQLTTTQSILATNHPIIIETAKSSNLSSLPLESLRHIVSFLPDARLSLACKGLFQAVHGNESLKSHTQAVIDTLLKLLPQQKNEILSLKERTDSFTKDKTIFEKMTQEFLAFFLSLSHAKRKLLLDNVPLLPKYPFLTKALSSLAKFQHAVNALISATTLTPQIKINFRMLLLPHLLLMQTESLAELLQIPSFFTLLAEFCHDSKNYDSYGHLPYEYYKVQPLLIEALLKLPQPEEKIFQMFCMKTEYYISTSALQKLYQQNRREDLIRMALFIHGKKSYQPYLPNTIDSLLDCLTHEEQNDLAEDREIDDALEIAKTLTSRLPNKDTRYISHAQHLQVSHLCKKNQVEQAFKVAQSISSTDKQYLDLGDLDGIRYLDASPTEKIRALSLCARKAAKKNNLSLALYILFFELKNDTPIHALCNLRKVLLYFIENGNIDQAFQIAKDKMPKSHDVQNEIFANCAFVLATQPQVNSKKIFEIIDTITNEKAKYALLQDIVVGLINQDKPEEAELFSIVIMKSQNRERIEDLHRAIVGAFIKKNKIEEAIKRYHFARKFLNEFVYKLGMDLSHNHLDKFVAFLEKAAPFISKNGLFECGSLAERYHPTILGKNGKETELNKMKALWQQKELDGKKERE